MKLVVFDMDGTLIDPQSLPLAMARLTHSDDEVLIGQLVEDYRAHYRASLITEAGREGLFPGAAEALAALRGRPDTLLGIATGKGLAGVHRILALHGLSDHFVTLQTPDHNPSKPHPGMLETAMRETGAMPEETVIIGDTTFDIEMGVAAGTRSIGVTWGYHEPRELIAAGATTMIDRYDQLPGAVAQLLD